MIQDAVTRIPRPGALMPADAPTRQRPAGSTMYAWLAFLAEVTTVIQLADWRLTGDDGPAVGATLISAVGAALVGSDLLTRRGRPVPALWLAATSLLGLSVAIAALYSNAAGIGVIPLLTVALAVPMLPERQLVRLGVLAVAVATLDASVAAMTPRDVAAPTAIAQIAAGIGLGSAFLVATLIRQRRNADAHVARLASLIDGAPIGIFRSDTNARFIDVNAAAVRLLGYPDRESLLGQPVDMVFIEPDERRAIRADLDREGIAYREVELRRIDGRSAWARVRTRAELAPDGTVRWFEGTVEDIGSERDARAAREHLAAIVESATDAVLSVTLDGIVTSWNAAAERMFGYPAAEMVGASIGRLMPDDRRAEPLLLLHRVADGELVGGIETEQVRSDGAWITAAVSYSPLRGPDGAILGASVIARDVTAQRRLEARVARLIDDRGAILAALRALQPRETPDQTAAAICREIVSKDRLQYAAVMAFEGTDRVRLLARLGPDPAGDVPGLLPAPTARMVVARMGNGPWIERLGAAGPSPHDERLHAAGLRQIAYLPLEYRGDLVGALAAGTSSSEGLDLEDRLDALAEFAAVSAALLGPGIGDRRETDRIRALIEDVVTRRAFRPVFQPIVDLESRGVLGYEALTRFADGASPERMFTQAHEVGLGLQLEAASLDVVFEAADPLPPNAFLDLNVSPELILTGNVLPALLGQFGSPVVLEITEHTPVADYVAFRRAIASLGPSVRLAVDDAGAGYASLRHILELRPAYVKLDRELVRDIDADPSRQALVAGMQHFAESTGCILVAEGIETEAESTTVRSLGVRVGQGYLFGAPRSADEVLAPARRRAIRSVGPRRPRRVA